MIPVAPQPEPLNFEDDVRTPGQRFLRANSAPKTKEWRGHEYWRSVLASLHKAYGGICAYSCHWIPFDTGSKTVEHFVPKSKEPQKAYEWSNYRLVCGTLNGRKGTNVVLDPFTIKANWFILDFPSLYVKPSPGLSRSTEARVRHTIKCVRLNDEATCVPARKRYVEKYCTNAIDMQFLQEEAPFIARELVRQGLTTDIIAMMGF